MTSKEWRLQDAKLFGCRAGIDTGKRMKLLGDELVVSRRCGEPVPDGKLLCTPHEEGLKRGIDKLLKG